MPDVAGLFRMLPVCADGAATHLVTEHERAHIGGQNQGVDAGSVPAFAQQGLSPHQCVDAALTEQLCDGCHHMGAFSPNLKQPVPGFPDGREGAFTSPFFQQLLHGVPGVCGKNHHGAAETSQPDSLRTLSPEKLKNRHCSDFCGKLPVGSHQRQLVFLDEIAQNQQPQLRSQHPILGFRNFPDAVQLSPAFCQQLFHGFFLCQRDFFPGNAARFLQFRQNLLALAFQYLIGVCIIEQKAL